MEKKTADTIKRIEEFLARRPDLDFINLVVHGRYSNATCYQWRKGNAGTLRLNADAIAADFERVLDLAERGEILQPGGEAFTLTEAPKPEGQKIRRARDFYLTQTVKRINQVFAYCADQAALGCITGDYGTGKTEALNHWRTHEGRTVNHIVFEFDEFSARSVIDFVSCLAEQLQIETKVNQMNGGPMMRRIADEMAKAPTLLILDQCEACTVRVLQVVRQIWDRARHGGLGIVMLASPMLAERLVAARARDLGALTSRIGVWAALNGLQKAEIADIVRLEGVKQIDEAALDLLCRAVNGSMRRLMAVTNLLIEKHDGKSITVKTIEGVAHHLWRLNVGVARVA